jgi:hypothetical protein
MWQYCDKERRERLNMKLLAAWRLADELALQIDNTQKSKVFAG